MSEPSTTKTIAVIEQVFSYLEHEARGHLSVLSNDLAYWSGLLPAGETERARRKIAELCELFSIRQRLLSSCASGEEHAHDELSRLIRALLESCGQGGEL